MALLNSSPVAIESFTPCAETATSRDCAKINGLRIAILVKDLSLCSWKESLSFISADRVFQNHLQHYIFKFSGKFNFGSFLQQHMWLFFFHQLIIR